MLQRGSIPHTKPVQYVSVIRVDEMGVSANTHHKCVPDGFEEVCKFIGRKEDSTNQELVFSLEHIFLSHFTPIILWKMTNHNIF